MNTLFDTDMPITHNSTPTLRWCLRCWGSRTGAAECRVCLGLGYEERELFAEEMATVLAQGAVSTAWLRARMRRDAEVTDDA